MRDPAALGCAGAYVDMYSHAGRFEEAIELIDAALVRFPGLVDFLPQLFCRRAELSRELYRFDDAFRSMHDARAALRPETDPADAFYVVGAEIRLFLDIGLLEPAREAAKELERIAGEVAETERVREDPDLLRGLARDVATYLSAIESESFDYEGAVRVLDRTLSDPALFPQPSGKEWKPSDAERTLLLRRGIFAVYQAWSEASLGTDVAAILERARTDLESVLGDDPIAAVEEGILNAEEVRKASLALADLAWLVSDRAAEDEALGLFDAVAESGASRVAGDVGRRVVFAARRALLELAEAKAAGQAAEDRVAAAIARLAAERERLEAIYAEIEDAWLRVPRPAEGLGFLQGDVHLPVFATWLRSVMAEDAEDGERAALDVLARLQAVGTIALRRGGRSILSEAPSRARRFLSALPEGAGVVVFLPTLETTFVFAADAERVVCRETAPRPRLRREVAALARDLLVPPPSDEASRERRRDRIQGAAESLSGLLFPDGIASRVARWNRVAFVGAELLGGSLLESVPLGGAPLGDSHATSYLPGLALGDLLASEWGGTVRRPSMLLLAGPERDDELTLDLAPSFLRGMRTLIGEDRVRDSDEACVADRKELRGTDVLAFLAHGAYDGTLRRPATVAMASCSDEDDGMLTCEKLEGLAPLPRLVLFLACDSALGPVTSGDAGVADLGGAALLGGASAALVSSNDVSLRAAEVLLPALLDRMLAGDPPDEALRRARLDVGAQPGLADPFYTSSLRLFGLGHLPLAEPAENSERR